MWNPFKKHTTTPVLKVTVDELNDATSICGYKDIRGHFHSTLEEAIKRNRYYKAEDVIRDLRDFVDKHLDIDKRWGYITTQGAAAEFYKDPQKYIDKLEEIKAFKIKLDNIE